MWNIYSVYMCLDAVLQVLAAECSAAAMFYRTNLNTDVKALCETSVKINPQSNYVVYKIDTIDKIAYIQQI